MRAPALALMRLTLGTRVQRTPALAGLVALCLRVLGAGPSRQTDEGGRDGRRGLSRGQVQKGAVSFSSSRGTSCAL